MFSLAAATASFRQNLLLPSLARSLVNRAVLKPVPPPTEAINTPSEFLRSIGRSLDTRLSPETWEDLWRTSGLDMRKAGLSVRDRRYTLWCMAKFRKGIPVEEFAHEPKPKKAIRGWGPSVQNGKRIRSRRIKDENLKKKKLQKQAQAQA